MTSMLGRLAQQAISSLVFALAAQLECNSTLYSKFSDRFIGEHEVTALPSLPYFSANFV